jgi:DNA replication and repair protein RecF
MRADRLRLRNFRNYEEADLEFDPKRNVIIGENAQGKTNLIEAVYLCAFARSFRTNVSSDMIMFGKDSFTVSVDAFSGDIEKNISITASRNGKKIIKKDGKVLRRTSDLLNSLVVVVFSPEDLRIIKDSPEKRRSFIDREMCQLRPKYYSILRSYFEVLKQKNSVLRNHDFSSGVIPTAEENAMLDVFDLQLAKYGSEIIKYRRDFVNILSENAAEIQRSISGGREELRVVYDESVTAEQIYDMISASRENDMRSGHSSLGPQRDDLSFFINDRNAKKFGSQGQQRTIALSLKLAEIKIARSYLGENAVLLLDDVLSELDSERQRFLFSEIDDVQLFITSTDVGEELLETMESGKIFHVEGGKIV